MVRKVRVERYSLTPEGYRVARHLLFLSHFPKFIKIFFEWFDDAKLFISCAKDVYRGIYNEWKQEHSK